ncbi:MAG: alpha-2-macroglobulin family protein [Ferruginibacter sp.]
MLLIIAAISQTIMAQVKNDYALNWKKVEAFEKKGLTKSALAEVMVIYNQAIKDNNDAQQIKSSIYQIKYRQVVEQDSRENNIFYIDTLIAKAKAPVKNILQSMQAEMFWQYLQNNRYKFYDRTKLEEEQSKDITTWSLDKLHATISQLYIASLGKDEILKQTKLETFEPIIVKGENTRKLRPTLFDFLANRALVYFMNDERDLTKPSYHFILNDTAAFAPVTEFIKAPFTTKDSASLQHKAILIFQDILKFHLKDDNKNALLDADLNRLNFVSQFAINQNKTALYEAALKNIEVFYSGNPGIAQAMYLRATIYNNKGQQFVPAVNTTDQYEIKRAKELCDEVINKYPGTEGAANCQNLRNQILLPSLNLQTEKVNVPNQAFRTLVKYKNLNTVYFRLIKTTREEIKKLDRRDYDKMWKDITAIKSFKNWSVAIPDLKDYQNHAVEIKVDALENGTYYLMASIDGNFALEKNIIVRELIYVSNISYIHNNNNEYYVLNRDNGQPLPKTAVQVWQTSYNYNKNQNEELKAESYTTDKNGYFKLTENKQYRNFTMQFKTGNDELFLDENNYNNYYNSYEQPVKPQTFLFTDRAIYRPGQIVYFKGIVLKKGDKKNETSILPNFNSFVQLKDANGQKLNELKLTTNDFGSYNGSFKLPQGSLNGQFSLYDSISDAYQYFSVEEYKRPKFFTEVKKPAGTYRINDTVHVTGFAKAFAGNTIDGAAVKYRVVRKVRYQPWWNEMYSGYGRKIMPPGRQSQEMEITNGEVTTDSKGEFMIHFKAIPDETIDKKDQPTFYYEVSADVTDLNGETRSASTSIAVAYQSLQLTIQLPEKLPVDSLKKLLVKSTNLNDIEEGAIATVTIQRLNSPGKVFRERYWEQPDQFLMSKDEYYQLFPYDVYKDENLVKNYSIAEKLLDKTDSTNKQWTINNNQFKAGWYKITATAKDKYGELVTTEKYIQLTDNKQANAGSTPIIVDVKKAVAEPGDKVEYTIKTGFQNIWLIHTLTKVDSNIVTTYQSIKANQPLTNSINVSEKDRGGMILNYAFIQHNRIYDGAENFNIPWNNKDLDISYETFRDKILPGSKEKWTVKISGSKGEKVAAEMLAGMYDASLDQFREHNWSALKIWPMLYNSINWNGNGFNISNSEVYSKKDFKYLSAAPKSYDRLLGFTNYGLDEVVVVGYGTKRKSITSRLENENAAPQVAQGQIMEDKGVAFKMDSDGRGVSDTIAFNIKTGISKTDNQSQSTGGNDIQIRKNFNETAFFFPDLKTDDKGNISFEFTMPEALTEWKLMTFAHTKDLSSGYTEKSVVTQKPLMVQPNAPRFMREGDRMEFSAKIVNLSEAEITGTVQLELMDATTNTPIDGWFKNVFPNQYFTVAVGQSVPVKFPMEIPFNFNSAMTYRITAKSANNSPAQGPDLSGGAGGFSDGEEMAIPVLTNRMLVTESMPINLHNSSSKTFKFDKLLNSESSTTLTSHALTVEYTANPAWYAVQSLPYLMEYPYECAEQVFNRYYANTLASFISNSTPKIKAVFDKWKTLDTAALQSNLQKNEELKAALLQETPWVLDAQNESKQKQQIALLFDLVKMSAEAEKAINKIKDIQSPNGGFVWFKGGPDDRYITQYILTGIGHLKKLNALNLKGKQGDEISSIINKAIPYLDKKIKEDYDNLIKYKANLKNNNLGYTAIQYLYMRSFFTDRSIDPSAQTAVNYYTSQAKKYWLSDNKYMQAMIALALYRGNDKLTPIAIIKSLKENSITNEELGMFWKEWNTGGYYWHQAPIESQALMIEAFTDIDKNKATIDELKTWLLKQKQTQNWRTTKATAEACYALLLNGSDWLSEEKEVVIQLGNTVVKSTDKPAEGGTGYFKKRFESKDIKPQMGNISVSVKPLANQPATSSNTGWGSVYWQYFEDLDKITTAATPLKLTKQLFIEKNTDKGPQLVAIEAGKELHVGDKVKVRITLKVDRDMEYVHMKDMRAACMEPVNVLSGYKYQGGLGYYESTLDASANFFFGSLTRGSYVFEYDLFVTLPGNFSNGITTIQCMYAPEFTSHSEGIRVDVEASLAP